MLGKLGESWRRTGRCAACRQDRPASSDARRTRGIARSVRGPRCSVGTFYPRFQTPRTRAALGGRSRRALFRLQNSWRSACRPLSARPHWPFPPRCQVSRQVSPPRIFTVRSTLNRQSRRGRWKRSQLHVLLADMAQLLQVCHGGLACSSAYTDVNLLGVSSAAGRGIIHRQPQVLGGDQVFVQSDVGRRTCAQLPNSDSTMIAIRFPVVRPKFHQILLLLCSTLGLIRRALFPPRPEYSQPPKSLLQTNVSSLEQQLVLLGFYLPL